MKATDTVPAIICFKSSFCVNSDNKCIFEEYASATLRVEGGNMFIRNMNLLTPRLHYFRSGVFIYSITGPSSLAYVTGLKNWKKIFHPKAGKHLRGYYLDGPFFLWRNSPNSSLGRITVEVYRSHIDTHNGRNPLNSDQFVAEAATCTTHKTQETNIYSLTGIRTRVPSNPAATNLCLSPHGRQRARWALLQ